MSADLGMSAPEQPRERVEAGYGAELSNWFAQPTILKCHTDAVWLQMLRSL
jgi:hypothetical protein